MRRPHFNHDGVDDGLDADALTAAIAASTNGLAFDLTGDRLVNRTDRDAWLVEAGQINLGPGRAYLLGDANLDGVVDGQDFVIWNSHKFTAVAAWSRGDFNADGLVDGSDFILWNENKFQSSDLATGIRIVDGKASTGSGPGCTIPVLGKTAPDATRWQRLASLLSLFGITTCLGYTQFSGSHVAASQENHYVDFVQRADNKTDLQ